MPPFDENGNMIGMDDFPIFLRGDDAKEYILPGSISETVLTENPDNPDDLPPEAENMLKSITAEFEAMIGEETAKTFKEQMDSIVRSFEERFRDCMVQATPPRRFLRKLKRWDERNRRRRLKGLPEKPNPYYGSCWFTFTIPVREVVYDCDFPMTEEAQQLLAEVLHDDAK